MSKTTQNREGRIVLIIGIHRFHKYAYDMNFTFVIDQHSLTALFGHKSGVSALVVGQLQGHR